MVAPVNGTIASRIDNLSVRLRWSLAKRDIPFDKDRIERHVWNCGNVPSSLTSMPRCTAGFHPATSWSTRIVKTKIALTAALTWKKALLIAGTVPLTAKRCS